MLTAEQRAVIEMPLTARVFLEGPAGCGKTTAGVERVLHLMAAGVPGSSILLITPQRALAEPFNEALDSPGVIAGGMVSAMTIGGLAQRMVDLFWPMAAGAAGFSKPDSPPIFLTLETAQYIMAHLVSPLLDEGLFDSLTIDRNRLYSQIIDNLNKTALVGFPYKEIGERLKAVKTGDPGQTHVYEDAQRCATRFREYCLAHNLLDFSLQLEVFQRYLWPLPACRNHLLSTFRHLVIDNLEEEPSTTQDLLNEWLPELESALLIYDWDAGYRRFLGADPENAYQLKDQCSASITFESSMVMSTEIRRLEGYLTAVLAPPPDDQLPAQNPPGISSETDRQIDFPSEVKPLPVPGAAGLHYAYFHFYPQLLDWVAASINSLIRDDGIHPADIVILAPYLPDALRFSIANRLEGLGIPVRSHRPSRALREEPAAQCLITLAMLAHPQWGFRPTRFDVAYALMQAIAELDLVRAQLLAENVYRVQREVPALAAFDAIRPEIQERITFTFGGLYDRLRTWLVENGAIDSDDHHPANILRPEEPLDSFLSRLFGEVLSQPGFGFHIDFNAGEVAANLVESARKFRQVAGAILAAEGQPVGSEYIKMVQDGVIAAAYLRSRQAALDEAVLIAPAYTFLMNNRPARIQYWLDVGSRGWAERLNQPLTHPYVLSRAWPVGQPWTDADEIAADETSLYRLAHGLVRRCREAVYLGFSELSEQGYEERGPLLRALQKVIRSV